MTKQQHPFPGFWHYCIFSHNIATDLSLPDLPPGSDEAPTYRAFRLASGQPAPLVKGCFRRWETDERTLIMTGDYIDQGFVLSFPEIAEFFVYVPYRSILYRSACHAADGEIGRLLIGQVLPRLLAQEGRLVLHASGVRIGTRGLCFMGPSTSGKSTLASALHAQGYHVMSDDAVMVRSDGGEWMCVPAYPGLRLWPDSLSRVLATGTATALVHGNSEKHRVRLTAPNSTRSNGSVALAAIFVLDSNPCKSLSQVCIERLEPIAAVAEFLVESFKLDTGNAVHMRSQMSQMAALSTSVPVYRLRYPRVYERLPEVCGQIVAAIS